jgi:hypothetical protein
MYLESRSDEEDQEVKILKGPENILKFYISRMGSIKKDVVCCYDYAGPIRIKETVPIWEADLEVDKRGVKIRFLTEIRNENLEYCKKMLKEIKHLEMRHSDGVRGNFTIHDRTELFLPMFVNKLEEPVKDALFCAQKEMVEAHLFIFESLWKNGIPAEDRLREIEEGIKPFFTEIVRDPIEIEKITLDLVKSASKEVQLMFSTANTFSKQEGATVGNHRLLKLLSDKISKDSLEVRIILPAYSTDNLNPTEISTRYIRDRDNKLAIQYLDSDLQTAFSTIIVDRKFLLAVEYKDGVKDLGPKSRGIGTYSNSEATIMSYASIFDALWVRSELRQSK